MPVLLATAYFPPVGYFAAMARDFILPPLRQSLLRPEPSVVWIEAMENYQKQSYRTRCHFYAASGMQTLSVPVVHDQSGHCPIRDVAIDYSRPWIQQHFRAIVSAYRTSAYFEYYQDELFSIIESRPEKLFDLNLAIIGFFIRKTGLGVDLRFTESYEEKPDGVWDLRDTFHPKRPDGILGELNLEKPYFQVFSRKYGFIPNLSIMDLLFNEGPDSIIYLKNI